MNALCSQALAIQMLIAPIPMALTAVHVKEGSLEVASFAKVRSVRYSKFTLSLKKVTFHTLGNVYTFSYIYPIYDKIMYRRKHSRKH